jgi:hypothetical protein
MPVGDRPQIERKGRFFTDQTIHPRKSALSVLSVVSYTGAGDPGPADQEARLPIARE